LAAGESVVAVVERLGRDDATLVLSSYGHLMPGSEDLPRKAEDAAWNPVSEDSGEAGTARDGPDDHLGVPVQVRNRSTRVGGT
jgi:hypothetical protein